MKGWMEIASVLLAGCGACHAQTTGSQSVTITVGDASVVVTEQTACAHLASICGVDAGACTAAVAELEGNAPIDLACAQTAANQDAAARCPGFQSMCASSAGGDLR
jgi:hypothetical protein